MKGLSSNCGVAKRALLLTGLGLAVSAQADLPTEREVTTVRSVQVYGGQARPIGAIDFSASGAASRRFGPWDVETDAFGNTDGVIFYDDGSARSNGSSRQYNRPDGSRCETLGNVTVCR